MHLISRLGVAAAIALAGGVATAAVTAPGTAATEKSAAKPAKKKTSASRKELNSQAKGLALATTTVEAITESQLAIASRVLTGKADCEFAQSVQVDRLDDRPGYFRVSHKKASYTMVPEETTTGAVRLVDKQAGVIWLQIPVKSMMMNSKLGQRVVDGCTHAEQRAAVSAVRAASPAGTQ